MVVCFRQSMSFDTLAPHYRWMEFILAGEKLQQCRTNFLDAIPVPKNILLLGEGHGRCLVECCRRFPDTHVTCVDVSQRMLTQSKKNLARHKLDKTRTRFIHADILEWIAPRQTYDLIISNFFLDCFPANQLQQIIPRIATAAAPDANWLIADFQVASRGLKRVRSKIILAIMYRFFRVATRLPARKLVAPDLFFHNAGFHLHRRDESDWGLLHSDWWMKIS
jgi:ubiquinone/menaquinone biosynthesis C-methylase UbiE